MSDPSIFSLVSNAMKSYPYGGNRDDDQEMGGMDYIPEAEVYPSTGRTLLYKTSLQDWLMDATMIPLNMAHIASMLHIYDHDPNVRTVTHIYQSNMFAGGVTFERTGRKMSEVAAKWYNATWSSFGTNVDRYQTALGWAPCTHEPHPMYIGVPLCLDVTRCTILYKKDVYGVPHFLFLENITNPIEIANINKERSSRTARVATGTGPVGCFKYIPNVVVYYETEPDAAGRLRSRCAVLHEDMLLDRALSLSTRLASDARANPPLVLESMKEKYDSDSVVSAVQPLASMLLGDGTQPADTEGDNQMEKQRRHLWERNTQGEQEELERKRWEYSKLLNSVGPQGVYAADSLARAHIRGLMSSGFKEYYVGDGKKYVKHTLPEGPGDLMINFRNARMERVFMIFGIPMGMISTSSALGGKTSMNQNALIVFTNTQKQKKQQLLTYLYDMYARIYAIHHALHRISETPVGGIHELLQTHAAKGTSFDRNEVGVKILMTGLPSDELLNQLYLLGAIKYESYIRFMANKHCIPIEDFNPTPKMTLLDLNGVKPENSPGDG
jgi:hypothetical protein